ncbi:MAG: tyrosine recombinase XerC [Candidatus Sulfotelmatobacter sp.]
MRGHIRERSPGHWAIVVDVSGHVSGKRKRRWHSFKGTKREAHTECARLISEQKLGLSVDPSRETVAEFLDRWLDHMKTQLTPRSHERYAELVRKNIVPVIGRFLLTKLQPTAISQAYARALASGRRMRTRTRANLETQSRASASGLSPATVHYMHRVLRQALQQAVRWQLLVRNPADLVKPPRIERREMSVLSADATAELLEAVRDTTLHVPVLLGVLCGLRRGEIVALRWRAVDLEHGQLSVVASTEQTSTAVREKPPKSGRGRTVALPSLLTDELRQYRIKQAEALLRLGVRLNDDHHVVMKADGQPIQPRSLTHAFEIFLRQRKLPRVRLHDLRHTHATQLLASGVHPKVAQERLGHSSVAITLDLYSHVLPGIQEAAASRVDVVVRDAIDRRRAGKG